MKQAQNACHVFFKVPFSDYQNMDKITAGLLTEHLQMKSALLKSTHWKFSEQQ